MNTTFRQDVYDSEGHWLASARRLSSGTWYVETIRGRQGGLSFLPGDTLDDASSRAYEWAARNPRESA